MGNLSFRSCLLLIVLVAIVPADAKIRRNTNKAQATAAAKKAPATGNRSRKLVATPVASQSKVRNDKNRNQRSRRAPRQTGPTQERYMEIQQALIDKGYHSGPADGVWGAEWVASLKHFQKEQNLQPDGKLGALSLIALGLGPKREPVSQFAGKPESAQ